MLSSNDVASQVRTVVVPEAPGSVRGEFRRFSATLFNFRRFRCRYAPKIHLASTFLGCFGTLFEECARSGGWRRASPLKEPFTMSAPDSVLVLKSFPS